MGNNPLSLTFALMIGFLACWIMLQSMVRQKFNENIAHRNGWAYLIKESALEQRPPKLLDAFVLEKGRSTYRGGTLVLLVEKNDSSVEYIAVPPSEKEVPQKMELVDLLHR